jgi:multidrug efflux pump
MVVSLTTTPMMCAKLLKPAHGAKHGRLYRATEALFEGILSLYRTSLQAVLRHQPLTLLVFFATMGLTVYLYVIVPKGFFPQQDTGRLIGSIQADQDTSYQAMARLMERFATAVAEDPAVVGVTAFTGGQGGGSVNSGRMFVALKPPLERVSTDQLMARLRRKLSSIPGATLFLQPTQDLRIGGRASSAQFQFVLQGDNLADLGEWGQKVLQKLRTTPGLVDVNSDQQNRGLQASLVVDRNAAARLGISPQSIDDTLYSAFGQRQVSTIFTPLSQYRVVMGVEEQFASSPESLEHIYLKGAGGKQVPLSAIARFGNEATALSVNHSGLFPSIAISFNLTPGTALGEAVERIRAAEAELRMPPTIRTSFSGAAQAFQSSLSSQPLLILAALVTVYIVLGMLYESYIHPITILSTLPSAGMGALIALLLFNVELSVMALIGIILLIGIVKKNAIMMIDFALDAERNSGMSPERAIYEACVMRFRPITMTTMAALLGAIPLAFGTGTGSELRRPLGLAIVGGLIVSQMLTLYTTPVVYLYLDRARLRFATLPHRGTPPAHRAPGGLVPAGPGAA